MTLFADKLRYFLEEKNTTVYSISKITNIDRTMIQHMKAGRRLPSKTQDVLTIAKALMLTPNEEEELLNSYHISHMGEENFYRRRQVSQIISSFYDMNVVDSLVLPADTQQKLQVTQDMQEISGQANINRIVRLILEMEAEKNSGHVRICVQPEFSYVFDCIPCIDFNRNQTLVEAVIVFDKNESYKSTKYNLNVLRKLVPVLFQCDVFHPYYIYDNVTSLFNKTRLLPFKIITSEFALAVTYELDKAILYTNRNMLKLMQDNFQSQLSIASPVYHAFHPTPAEYLEATFCSDEELSEENMYELLYQPCFPSFCPEDILLDRLNKELVPPEMQAVIAQYFDKIRAQATSCKISFTLEGLRLFMETGRITEIPDFMYTYLTAPQRLTLLKNIVDSVDAGNFSPHIIRGEKFSVPSPLCICSPSPQKVTIYYFSPNRGQYIFRLQELSLVHAFHDFMTYLAASSLVYDEAESKQLLHSVLAEYQKKFSSTN